MAKIIDTSDFRKNRLLSALVNLPVEQQAEVESVIYNQVENFSEYTINNLKLLTSDSYIDALALKDQLMSKYKTTLFNKKTNLSLTELLQNTNITINQLFNIINIKLIQLNNKTINLQLTGDDFMQYINTSKASEFALALSEDQKSIIKNCCILNEEINQVSLPTEAYCPTKYNYSHRVSLLSSVGSQAIIEFQTQQYK